MKKSLIIATLSATFLLSGCSENKGSMPTSESALPTNADISADSRTEIKSELTEPNADFPPEEKAAPIVTIPSTFSADNYEPSFETDDAIIEPLFELDGSKYIWDELNFGYDFIVDENGDILIVTYNVGEEPVEISEYARSIKEDQGWDPPEILDAMQEIDALEYLGRAEFIEDKANAFEYHNSYLFRYKDKVLLIEPPSDLVEVYTSTMFKPCE